MSNETKSDKLSRKLYSIDLLVKAWKIVREKRAAMGIDKTTVDDFNKNAYTLLTKLCNDLRCKTWKPQPYMAIRVPKKTEGEFRNIGMLSVRDKVVQTAIKIILEPVLDHTFLNNSYGYRIGKGAAKAIRRAQQELRAPTKQYALRLDINNFFDTIDHDILTKRLMAATHDEELMRLIMLCVKMGHVNADNNHWEDRILGISQGAVLSPLLANLYLHSLDQFVTSKISSYIRYADDLLIICNNEDQAKDMCEKTKGYVKEKLHLTFNEPEAIIEKSTGIYFLGIRILPDAIVISNSKKSELTERIRSFQLTENGLDSKSKKSWTGMLNYYAVLLSQTYLEQFDEILNCHLTMLVTNFKLPISTIKQLHNSLNNVAFLSLKYQEKRAEHIKQIVEAFRSARKLPSRNTNTKSGKVRDENKQLNDKIIKSRKKEFEKREAAGRELVISKPGVFIGISSRNITIKEKGKLISTHNISNVSHVIICSKGISFSSNFLFYCLQNNISICFFDGFGELNGIFITPQYLQHTVWLKQSQMHAHKRITLAAHFIKGKLHNQLNLMKYFYKYHKDNINQLDVLLKDMEQWYDKYCEYLKASNYRSANAISEINGYESQGAIKYWAYIRALLNDDNITFVKREHHGATDLFNCMLNYGYAVLCSRILQVLLAARLNPYDSFLHVPQSGKPTLVYDFMEIYRSQVVDRIVVSLIQKGCSLMVNSNGMLTDDSKKLLLKNILERLERNEIFRKRRMSMSDILLLQARELADSIENVKPFKPYIAKW